MSLKEFDSTFERTVSAALQGAMPSDEVDLIAYGMDSLRFIQLLMELEDALGIFFDVEQLTDYGALTRVRELRRVCRTFAAAVTPEPA